MTNWEAQRDHYKQSGRLSDKAFEDMLGRRILRGLGGTEKQIYQMEDIVFSVTYGQDPLWTRASRLFLEMLARNRDYGYLAQVFKLAPIQASNDKQVLDYFEDVDLTTTCVLPLLFVMPKTAKQHDGLVYIIWDSGFAINSLKPPYKVLAPLNDQYSIIVQDIVHFIQQFGPYFTDWQVIS